MLVEPGFFCTELLSPQSAQYAEPSVADRTTATVRTGQGMDGKQGGDPATLADDLVRLAALDDPPPALTPSNCSRSRPGPARSSRRQPQPLLQSRPPRHRIRSSCHASAPTVGPICPWARLMARGSSPCGRALLGWKRPLLHHLAPACRRLNGRVSGQPWHGPDMAQRILGRHDRDVPGPGQDLGAEHLPDLRARPLIR